MTDEELIKEAEEYADKTCGVSARKYSGWITCRDNYLAGRRKTLAELKEAFEAGRIGMDMSTNKDAWSWISFDDWYKARGEKL